METPFRVKPLPATFGAEVTGLRLADLDEPAFEALYRTWLEYALLIFPGQGLTAEQQSAFARRFGPLEIELGILSNLQKDGSVRPQDDDNDDMIKVIRGNMSWHCDSTYMPVQAKGAVFSAVEVPTAGGETEWADMRAAWDALDPSLQARAGGLSAYHSLVYSQGKVGHKHSEGSAYHGYGMTVASPPLRPLRKRHPETGRDCLMVGRHAYGVPGLPPEESERLLEDLADQACRAPRVWRHAWTPGDVVVWDNRALMHRGCPWDLRERRVMWHSRIAGDPATESGQPVA